MTTTAPHNSVRAIYRAALVDNALAPYNVAQLKIFYPATLKNTAMERNTGFVAAAEQDSPWPVVIIMPGINLASGAYQWLATKLASENMVVVTYNLVAEEMPDYIGITPGLDLGAIRPGTYGTRPSANALAGIIDSLHQVNQQQPLCGKLDLDCIIVGGHSAGGTAALLNANPDWFDGLKGVFTYGAHTGASTALGFADNTVLSINNQLPILIMGGTNDGCIAESQQRYGATLEGSYFNSSTARLEQTFAESIIGGNQDKYLCILDGANHFAIANPIDLTAGRAFIDQTQTRPAEEIHTTLGSLIAGFIHHKVVDPQQSPHFDALIALHEHAIALVSIK